MTKRQPTDGEKAAFIAGMVRAFESVGWPNHFNDDGKRQWRRRAVWARQMMEGGTFNPLNAFVVLATADEPFKVATQQNVNSRKSVTLACDKSFDCNAGDHSDCCPERKMPTGTVNCKNS